jgi:hypothetical protein
MQLRSSTSVQSSKTLLAGTVPDPVRQRLTVQGCKQISPSRHLAIKDERCFINSNTSPRTDFGRYLERLAQMYCHWRIRRWIRTFTHTDFSAAGRSVRRRVRHLHIPPSIESTLPQILSRCGPLSAIHPKDGDIIKPGVIYVAHGEHIAIKKGPKENRFRPSIDTLFRSAAYVFGPPAIGVVLSGALDDGTSGLWSIGRLGGTTIVQHPDEAAFESMPRHALEHIAIDHPLPASEMSLLLGRLSREPLRTFNNELTAEVRTRLKTEIAIAGEADAFSQGVLKLGPLTPFTCPECHTVLVRIPEGKMSRFRCHTGHAYTDSSLLEAVMETSGNISGKSSVA